MNEVNKIHLGRQAFTISADARHQLDKYLEAIKKQVKDKEVVEEIELRMAELLSEHGINDSKVILPSDVDLLKEQLGGPEDFKEDDSELDIANQRQSDGKRLFRDTDNAMIAGVAAGLSEYLGLDVLLIRILFIITAVFTVGWGILIYIVLWLLVPEAKTPSDRLRMAGKPVTVNSLKEVVERADVKGAAHRANNTLAGPINRLFRIILKLVGLAFVLFGLSIIFGLIVSLTYYLFHQGAWIQSNIFPVGLSEHLLLYLTMSVLCLVALFIILFGLAIFQRKWPIRAWITGMLAGLVFIGLAAGGALAADAIPKVHDRYNADRHTTIRYTKPFTTIGAVGSGVDINFQTSDKYYVSLNYYGHPNLGSIKTNVTNDALLIDSSQFDWHRHCQTVCLPNTYDVIITVYSPNSPEFKLPNKPLTVFPDSYNIYQQ